MRTMNERIEGLWWQARIGYNNQNCDPEVVAKFAKLIVQECATIINDIPSAPQGSWSDGYYEGCRDSANQIRQHFGIEE